MIDLDPYIAQEGRSVVLDADVLVEYGYDEVIESCRPAASWHFTSLERCCEDHVVLIYDRKHD